MLKVKAFRALIYGAYDSEAEFARAIGMPRQTLNKISNGQKEPNINEINIFAKTLGVDIEKVMQIFLQHKSPNEQPDNEPKTA